MKPTARNKYVQTEEELTLDEEKRQKDLMQAYGNRFRRGGNLTIFIYFIGNSNYNSSSYGESSGVVYRKKQPNLELFPPTIHEEGDYLDSIPTPSPRTKRRNTGDFKKIQSNNISLPICS
jgi:hypothetical protein